MELTALVGDRSDEAAREVEGFIRSVLRRSYGSNAFVRRYEDDIVQHALITAVEWAERVRRGEKNVRNVKAWLARVALNEKNRYWRRIGERSHDELEPEEQPLPDPVPVNHEDKIWIRRALERLDEECRSLLVRFHALGESGKELASDLGLTPGNVRVKLHRCRKRLVEMHEEGAVARA